MPVQEQQIDYVDTLRPRKSLDPQDDRGHIQPVYAAFVRDLDKRTLTPGDWRHVGGWITEEKNARTWYAEVLGSVQDNSVVAACLVRIDRVVLTVKDNETGLYTYSTLGGVVLAARTNSMVRKALGLKKNWAPGHCGLIHWLCGYVAVVDQQEDSPFKPAEVVPDDGDEEGEDS